VFSPPGETLADFPALKELARFGSSTWTKGGMFKLMPYTIEVK
jgi:hypothetical protein